jgi:hypothetical protein
MDVTVVHRGRHVVDAMMKYTRAGE